MPPAPPEIWLRILQLATDLPDDFDIQLWRLETPKKHAEAFLRARLVTVRKLVRVCRLWHALATPLLYETLWISKTSRFELLLSTLLASQSSLRKDSESLSTALGSYVKRVVFTLANSFDLLPSIISLISLSSSSLISLHFLTPVDFIHDRRGLSHGIPPALINSLPSASLQVLNLSYNSLCVNTRQWRQVVETMVSLRTFRCDLSPPDFADLMIIYGLENLERICTPLERSNPTRKEYPSRPSLPNVVEVIYQRTPSNLLRHPNLLALVPHFGKSLTRMTFSLYEPSAIIQDFSPLSTFFPNLTRMDIRFLSWVCMRPFQANQRLALPASVTHLGLMVQEVQEIYSHFIQFCACIVGEKLRVIQLDGRQTCIDLRCRHANVLKQATDALRVRGIKFLDWDGTEMVESGELVS